MLLATQGYLRPPLLNMYRKTYSFSFTEKLSGESFSTSKNFKSKTIYQMQDMLRLSKCNSLWNISAHTDNSNTKRGAKECTICLNNFLSLKMHSKYCQPPLTTI